MYPNTQRDVENTMSIRNSIIRHLSRNNSMKANVANAAHVAKHSLMNAHVGVKAGLGLAALGSVVYGGKAVHDIRALKKAYIGKKVHTPFGEVGTVIKVGEASEAKRGNALRVQLKDGNEYLFFESQVKLAKEESASLDAAPTKPKAKAS